MNLLKRGGHARVFNFKASSACTCTCMHACVERLCCDGQRLRLSALSCTHPYHLKTSPDGWHLTNPDCGILLAQDSGGFDGSAVVLCRQPALSALLTALGSISCRGLLEAGGGAITAPVRPLSRRLTHSVWPAAAAAVNHMPDRVKPCVGLTPPARGRLPHVRTLSRLRGCMACFACGCWCGWLQDPGICSDEYANCDEWVKRGECEKNRDNMVVGVMMPGCCRCAHARTHASTHACAVRQSMYGAPRIWWVWPLE